MMVLLKISITVFMAGNLLGMGLKLSLQDAFRGLRNVRFVLLSLIWGFVLGPALAWLLTRLIPMDPSFAAGLILIGMTPVAPFLPMLTDRARGDINYAAVTMLLAAVVTVLYLPFGVALLLPDLTVSVWAIARPLLLLVLLPLAAGIGIRGLWKNAAGRIEHVLKKLTGLMTILMLVLIVVIYGKSFIEALGHFAVAAQLLLLAALTAASHISGFGMPANQKSVLSLGLSTRNLGAAFAPLLAAAAVDEKAVTMVALGVPLQFLVALIAASIFAKRSERLPV
jgi:BASS family bile acid:Na+ symporter